MTSRLLNWMMPNRLQPRDSLTPELGLVCITASQAVRFRTLTRKRFLTFTPSEQEEVLRELYSSNLKRLGDAIAFCATHQIRLYRVIDRLFPFADEPVGAAILLEFGEVLKELGDRATELGIRLVQHPSQYVVLSSDNPEVITNSIGILQTHAWVFDLLGLPQSPWAAINIHGGKGDRAERLINVIQTLPENVRSRLTFENDEYAYGATEILAVCQAAGVPMVFDAHHHLIHDRLPSYDDPSVAAMLTAAQATWPNPDWQLVHISNGREFLHDPKHSDLIEVMPIAYWQAPWIEVEAKLKEQAVQQLQQSWLPQAQSATLTA